MGVIGGLLKILRGMKMSVESQMLFPFRDKVDNLRMKSPEFGMFFDSKLGSPIETATKKLWTDAMINDFRVFLPKGMANIWGNTLGDRAGRMMDKKKLKYHYMKGWISVNEYAERRATQIQANIINSIKRPILDSRDIITTVGLGDYLDKFDKLTKPAIDALKGTIAPVTGPLAEKSKDLMAKGIATFHKGITEVKQLGREVYENVAKPILDKTAKVIGNTASTLVDFGKKSVNAVKSVVGRIFKFLTRR